MSVPCGHRRRGMVDSTDGAAARTNGGRRDEMLTRSEIAFIVVLGVLLALILIVALAGRG